MDFVFDRTAEGRVIKCLTIVDDATHEAVAIEIERAISGIGVTRVMDRLAIARGLPKVIRSDNGISGVAQRVAGPVVACLGLGPTR